jgi:lipoate-protein ligase A
MGEYGDVIRLLIDPPLGGPTNMARDEALLQRVACRDVASTMRLYQWDPSTLSLGYFQPYADVLTQPPTIQAMPVVRRLTGGGAIIHENELTYSLTLPNDHPLLADGPVRLYELVHDAAIEMLAAAGIAAQRAGCNEPSGGNAQRGPFLCFQRRHNLDVVVGHRKILGSAQRRTTGAVLQHGSLQLAGLGQPSAGARHPAEFAGPLVEAFTRRTGLRPVHVEWCAECLALADQLKDKYAETAWTRRR